MLLWGKNKKRQVFHVYHTWSSIIPNSVKKNKKKNAFRQVLAQKQAKKKEEKI